MTGINGLTNTGALNISNTFAKKTSEASDSTQIIAGGSRLIRASVDASSLAIAEKLRSNIEVLTQANRNASQGAAVVQLAVGAQQNILSLLTSMKALTTKANDGSQDANARALIDQEFQKLLSQVDNIANQVRWNGAALLTGAAGAVSVAAANANNVISGYGTLVANTFAAGPAPVSVANSQGFISGAFTNATVVANGVDFNVTVTMQNLTPGGAVTQVFTGTVAAPSAGGNMILTSTTDGNNVLQFNYDAANVGGLNNAANFQTALQSVLNIGPNLAGATVKSVATAYNGGVTAVAASSFTPTGSYSLTYNNVSNVMRLSTGAQVYDVTLTEAGAQTVNFSNGMSATLDGTFALGTAVTQIVFDVDASTSAISMNFQVAEKVTDVLTVDIAGSNVSSLGLSGVDVTTQANAQTAGALLDQALQTMNSSVASLGATQKQLEYASSNLSTTILNNVAARGVYNDADVPAEMTKLTQATVFAQLSQAMLSQSLEMQRGLVQLAR